MANAYPVAQSGWLGSLAHLLSFGTQNETDAEGIKIRAFWFFSHFLAIKIITPFAFPIGRYWPLSFGTVMFLSFLAISWSRFYYVGLWGALTLSFYECWRSWPFTINHCGLEFGILLLICLTPDDPQEARISCGDMIKILMLSVWFFSGLHKLLDGYYWNAEFFALEALASDTTLGRHLNHLLSFCGSQGLLQFNFLQTSVLLALSWLTIGVEILLPLSLCINKIRPLAIVGLFIFQAFVSYFSGEIDFAFTAFAILFLFIPRHASIAYPSLACLFLVVQPWI